MAGQIGPVAMQADPEVGRIAYLDGLSKRTKAKGGPLMSYIAQQSGRTLSKHFREFVLPRIEIRQPYEKRVKVEGNDTTPKQVGRKISQYSLHSLRHSLSTWLHAQGVEEMTRMRLPQKRIRQSFVAPRRTGAFDTFPVDAQVIGALFIVEFLHHPIDLVRGELSKLDAMPPGGLEPML